jgi:hypothetical protein
MSLRSPERRSIETTRARRLGHRVSLFLRLHADGCSWAIWVVGVLLFALWTLAHYVAPSGPPWFGMTIRGTTFAALTLVLREWCALRWNRGAAEQRSQATEEQKNRGTSK